MDKNKLKETMDVLTRDIVNLLLSSQSAVE